MARQYRNKGMVTIHGFEEMVELLRQMSQSGVEQAADQVFDECCGIIKESMDSFANGAIPASLAAKQTEFKVKHGNIRMYAYGFSDNDPESKMKACYLNYGTPRRATTKEVTAQVNGRVVNLGTDRGQIAPRGFISNGKRSAAQKINAKKKEMLKRLTGGGK